jgi:uncharacterized protein involved in propanediol utilization
VILEKHLIDYKKFQSDHGGQVASGHFQEFKASVLGMLSHLDCLKCKKLHSYVIESQASICMPCGEGAASSSADLLAVQAPVQPVALSVSLGQHPTFHSFVALVFEETSSIYFNKVACPPGSKTKR